MKCNMKRYALVLVLTFYTGIVFSQYTNIKLNDSIVLSDENTVFFNYNYLLKSNQLNEVQHYHQFSIDTLEVIDIQKLGFFLDSINKQYNAKFKGTIIEELGKNKPSVDKYGFQVIALTNDNNKVDLAIYVVLKSSFLNWKTHFTYVHDGGNIFSQKFYLEDW